MDIREISMLIVYNSYQKIGGKRCKDECSGQGICNRDLGVCHCFHGFSGESLLTYLSCIISFFWFAYLVILPYFSQEKDVLKDYS